MSLKFNRLALLVLLSWTCLSVGAGRASAQSELDEFEEILLNPYSGESPQGGADSQPGFFWIDEAQMEIVYLSADGKPGRHAKAPSSFGATPESGTSGTSGGNITIIVRVLPEIAMITARGGDGGNGADGTHGLVGKNGRDGRDASLFAKASAGLDGADGQDGGHGSHGGNAGAGGNIRIIYSPILSSDYDPRWRNHFIVDASGGVGGKAGKGAPGGAKGIGGKGGKKFWSKDRMPSGKDGQPGRFGTDGEAGKSSGAGSVEFIEVEDLDAFLVEDFSAL